MNPVVLIATHVRTKITSRNIEQLQRQSVVPHIVLVCSLFTEYEYYSEKFDGVTVILWENRPLGNKWQEGAYRAAKYFNADPLIILGSDDLLGAGYVETICRIMREEKLDFVGVNQWWIFNEDTGIMHRMKYANTDFPLGGGKAISARMLKAVNYQIFNTKLDRLLDNMSWEVAKKSRLPLRLIQNAHEVGLNIVSIKGNWETLNSAEAILKSKSCIEIERFINGKQKMEELL